METQYKALKEYKRKHKENTSNLVLIVLVHLLKMQMWSFQTQILFNYLNMQFIVFKENVGLQFIWLFHIIKVILRKN